MHDSASRNINVGCLSSPCRGEQVLHMYDMKMKLMMRILLLCFLSCFWFQLSFAQNATTDPSEVRALNSIFEQWDTQAASGLWNISGEPCSGSAINSTELEFSDTNPAIYCNCTYNNNATCHITNLSVNYLYKQGVFPEEFVALRYLTSLHMDNNYFTGPLPAFIGNMSALTELSISRNSFSGPIPKELGNLAELTMLSIASNNFSGTLPPELGNLVKLELLYRLTIQHNLLSLFNNCFQVSVCPFNMTCRDIGSNNFLGTLPPELGNLVKLENLSISVNSFFGPIPKELGNLTELTYLDIGSNNFSGTLPPELGNLVKLERLYLDSCGLGGEIPSTFANLTNMQTLWASDNPFSGKIPDFIGNWTQLTDLEFQGNSFEGPIPTNFSQLTSLLSLKLRNALITGNIPSDIGEYQSLETLFLGNNFLSGPLPSQKSDQLQTIDLSYNFLLGSFPQWVTTMSQLNLVVNNFIFDSSNIATVPGLNCLQRNFPCNRNTPRYASFSINCGGPQMMGRDGILYEFDDSALGPATFSVTNTEKWAVSNAGLFPKYRTNPSFLVKSHAQVTKTDVTPKLFQTSRMSPGSLRYYGLGLENGPYTVTLHFAETVYESRTSQIWKSLGRRVFDIYIQGTRRTKDFDISKEAGGVNRAVVRKFNVNVSENYLEIHLLWTGKGTCCIPNEGDYGPLIAVVHAVSVSWLPPTKKSRTGLIVGIAVPVGVGTLSDGRVVALKQLSVASHQGKSQFVSEIATISAVQHRNLVKLYGCCIEGNHRILVYEYLENKSLDQALFGTSNLHLDWPTRFNILLGTARGLAYLHEESRPRIVHQDVKASNILLDAELSPKISDFGLAKLYDDEKTHISTKVAGTIGYLAPEYALFGHLTEKADVFGFGVVVLEILSGRPNSYNNLNPEKIYLLEWGSPMARPSMSRVVAMLSGDIDIGTVMSKPSYLTDYNFKDVTTFSTGILLAEDDTPSTASKDSNVPLNCQPRGSNASGANTPWIDPASSVNGTGMPDLNIS
ncbi:hypothetical protein DVH24_011080 [Malus domestica]|uniref:non-specific serine/threonine protein kinase n=1 Tax=Malus domestica TaxID=3750 RepID=A0A498JU96_MALDO|nr:hypothetical protein DVH24_011080 [Malus domestica]